jgi:arylsulfatase A-like enzyme
VPKVPDLLAVYGSDLDDLAHEKGTESPDLAPLLDELDRQLGRLVAATKEAGVHERTAFVLTSDHGMTDWSRPLAGELARLSAGFRAEVVLPGAAPAPDAEVVIVPIAIRIADVTLLGRGATEKARARIRGLLEGSPGVARVLDGDDLDAMKAGGKHGDLVVEAAPPWGFSDAPPEGGLAAAHGSTREMRVPLLLAGAGVRRGVEPRDARLVDVAPTICALLGARTPKDAQGRALEEALQV